MVVKISWSLKLFNSMIVVFNSESKSVKSNLKLLKVQLNALPKNSESECKVWRGKAYVNLASGLTKSIITFRCA